MGQWDTGKYGANIRMGIKRHRGWWGRGRFFSLLAKDNYLILLDNIQQKSVYSFAGVAVWLVWLCGCVAGVAVWLCGCVAVWLCGWCGCVAVWLVWLCGCVAGVAVWLVWLCGWCGCVAVWLCGCVAVWLCGCVAVWLVWIVRPACGIQ